MFKNKISCYFTIEASFLMPLVTLGIWFIVMLGFYLYNLCCIHQISSIASLRGAGLKRESSQEIQQMVTEEVNRMMEEKLVLMEEKEQQVIVTAKEVVVKIQGKMKIPLFSLLSELIQVWEMKAEVKINRNHPVQIIRKIRKAGF